MLSLLIHHVGALYMDEETTLPHENRELVASNHSKLLWVQGMISHACNPSTWGAGGVNHRAKGQPLLHNEILS